MSFNRLASWWVAVLAAVSLTAAAAEPATGDAVVVGVFLPGAIGSGQERFKVGEALAAKLQESLGVPVTARSFGRFQDFSEALGSGEITVGIVDGWVAGQLPTSAEPIAVAGGGNRLQLVAKSRKSVSELKGTNLAVIRGTPGQEAKFASNVVFAGDLQAQKHFKVVSVPNAESALEALEAGAAEAALLPAGVSQGLTVIYAGPSLPTAVAVKGKKAIPAGLQAALLKVSVAPLERFSAARGDELSDLRTLTQRGPPRRTPVMAESAPERFDLGLVDFKAVELRLPRLSPSVPVPQESPDD